MTDINDAQWKPEINHLSLTILRHVSTITRSSSRKYIQRHKNYRNSVKVVSMQI